MDVNRAIRYVFEDKQWISKVLIAVVLSLFSWLIIPAFIVAGYMVKLVRQVMHGQDTPLPEWTDWGDLLRDGFFVVVAEFLWMLPFIVLILVIGLATGGLGSMSDGGDALAAATTGAGLLLGGVTPALANPDPTVVAGTATISLLPSGIRIPGSGMPIMREE